MEKAFSLTYGVMVIDGVVIRKGKARKQFENNGYMKVSLDDVVTAVHVIICDAFHDEMPEPGMVVRHLDDDRMNNSPDNLKWGTYSENLDDAYRNGRRLVKGDRNTSKKAGKTNE